jgi:hypothetical protein
MKKSIFLEKYPVYTLELLKDEIQQNTVNDIIDYYKAKIENHPIAKFIAIFDHFTHTKSIDGEINPEILDAQNIVFCFGPAIPNTKILAARPRSIGIAELEDKFVIEFLEAPKEQMHDIMEEWSKSLKV